MAHALASGATIVITGSSDSGLSGSLASRSASRSPRFCDTKIILAAAFSKDLPPPKAAPPSAEITVEYDRAA
jgi:hypothetical protein